MLRTCALALLLALPTLAADDLLPNTQPLTLTGEFPSMMLDGAHRFIERKIDESVADRQEHWRRDFSSREAYEKSVADNRARFCKLIGVVDARLPPALEKFGDAAEDRPSLVAETNLYRVYQVRWDVLPGVHGEGLLVEPTGKVTANVIAIPDADNTPEQILGLAPGLAPDQQLARNLANANHRVLIPTLVDRSSDFAGHPEIKMTRQTNREWIYRQAFQLGRHVIGYEVQKVLAAVDYFRATSPDLSVNVAGHGEGGLIAFYAAAADTRIDAAKVSGYFANRQRVWSEAIYRNVWGLLEEFGDAEIATLVAPRVLHIWYDHYPRVKADNGELKQPPFEEVRAEFDRVDTLVPVNRTGTLIKEKFQDRELFQGSAKPLAMNASNAPVPADLRKHFDVKARQGRQVRELEAHVQRLVRESDHVRSKYFLFKVAPPFADEKWSTAKRFPTLDPQAVVTASEPYRETLFKEVLGRIDESYAAPEPRTRKLAETDKWTSYDVVLQVWPEFWTHGVLLVPKDLKPNERRPVVVCQHGRHGQPKDVIDVKGNAYDQFAAKLADEGFITFAPQNLHHGEDRYRWLSRKGNGIKASLFSLIIAQHDVALRFLATLPFVDERRIAFYGLSYGGETAMRVPAVLKGYCLSICSGDFNQWTQKVAATDERFSFMYSIEWEMYYFNMSNTFDYAEMAYLIYPRPFMVERGHHDQVGRDRWVAYEYAKVQNLYDQTGLTDRTAFEYFNGGHAINAQGTFDFLHKHLNWPPK